MADVHWLMAVSGDFADGSAWSGGAAPGGGDSALIDAVGAGPYTVTTSGGASVAALRIDAEAALDIDAGTFAVAGGGANAGAVAIAGAASFTLGGTFANAGTITLLGTQTTVHPRLTVGAGGLTLTGGGEVVLADSLAAPFQPCPPLYSPDQVVGGPGTTLTNVDNTIVGAGYIGVTGLALVNGAGGVIDASLDTDLVIVTGGTAKNSGLIESTGAGGLYIVRTAVDGGAGGTISAAGGKVYLTDAVLIGGTLTASGAGYFYSDHGANVLDGASRGPLVNRAYVFVSDGSTVTLKGTIDNEGKIGVATSPGASTLFIGAGGATLSGGGEVALQGPTPLTRLTGAAAGATLTNLDDTIDGGGQLGAGRLVLVNGAAGVIDADHPIALVLDTGSAAVKNDGLLEATDGGELVIRNTTVTSGADGRILAASAAPVALQGATLAGGTLQSAGRGVFKTFAGVNTLDGRAFAVTNAATIDVQAGAGLTLEGRIVDTGEFVLHGGAAASATLTIGAAGATLSGGGVVSMDSRAGDVIAGAGAGARLFNLDGTIEGAGLIGGGGLILVNGAAGVIEGTLGAALDIDTGANAVVNAGLIEAAGAGGVAIAGAVANAGTLEAAGGVLSVAGAVSGAGRVIVDGGAADFAADFSQNVGFGAAGGVLGLALSQGYGGAVSGFSKTGATSLDLGDIAFVNAGEATFAASGGRGVLTVSDGVHTAHIRLVGYYRSGAFTAASDGHGGTLVTAGPPAAGGRFIEAAAGLGGGAGAAHAPPREAGKEPVLLLAGPRSATL